MSATWTMPRDMSGFSDLEAAMLAAIHVAGLPKPVAEWPFDKCCPHPEGVHREVNTAGDIACWTCQERAMGFGRDAHLHEYRRGRDWRFDFCWPEYMLAVECEGGTWSGGRHTRGDGFERDAEKYAEAAIQGWLVVRVTGAQVADGRALDMVERALAARQEAMR